MTEIRRCQRCDRRMWMSQDVPAGGLRHAGRRICTNCHEAAKRQGQLDEYPRIRRTTAGLADAHHATKTAHPDWTTRDIATHLGVSYDALRQALSRTRRTTTPR